MPIEQQDGSSPHPYIPNTQKDRREMLDTVGVSAIEDLFGDLPQDKLVERLNLPMQLDEQGIRRVMGQLSRENSYWDGGVSTDTLSFLGGGVYAHYIPAPIANLVFRGEFSTAYTPYQPEISQGTLRYTFDWQSMVCRLTGMDVANTGMYDGATALAEAALMTVRVAKATGQPNRQTILALDTIRPAALDVVRTYCLGQNIEIRTVAADKDLPLDENVAGVLMQYPNYFGVMEDVKGRAKEIHDVGAKLVTYTDNPMALGLFKSPGELGADIATGEAQSFGNRPSFGGPYIGFFAVKADSSNPRDEMIRQMPGRIVGETTDSQGRVGEVLTLQTREQHIRRERATSNICTAEALVALAATMYLSLVGNRGLREIAKINYHNARYTSQMIETISGRSGGYRLPLADKISFNELVVECPRPVTEIRQRLLEEGIMVGIDVSDRFENGLMICTTDLHTKEDIDRLGRGLIKVAL